MTDLELLTRGLALVVPGAPLGLVIILGFCSVIDRQLRERTISRLVACGVSASLLAALGVMLLMLVRGTGQLSVGFGHWIDIPHFHFTAKLLFDYLSLSFVILSLVLCGTIGAFANQYMHREPGYNRFFVLYAFFMAGMVVTALAGTIEVLFAGWELVGLSSALLVAFFHERAMPVRNGLRIWSIYRVSDAGLLIAAIVLHHLRGAGDFEALLGRSGWPGETAPMTANQALLVGTLLLVAAAGKSALVPFSGWLPRAMEGPTPSSAVFYGALSVHLGAYLLLRVSPILEASPLVRVMVVALGLAIALFAALASRVQTDIKSALCFASLTQVGLIVTEIGLGLYWIALVHIIGHAFLRTLQFVRAPTLLQDYRTLENAIGGRLTAAPGRWSGLLPEWARRRLYLFALERGYFDDMLNDWVVRPFVALFRWFDALERRWTDLLAGGNSRPSQLRNDAPNTLDELT